MIIQKEKEMHHDDNQTQALIHKSASKFESCYHHDAIVSDSWSIYGHANHNY